MLKRIATALWGNFESREEVQKFGFLAAIFFLIIGIYWGLRPMKDSIFDAIVDGKEWLWLAKIVSLLVISPLVILYGKLIDTFPRQKVFYALIGIYALLALLFSWAFMNPEIGLANTVQSPWRIIGWAWYVYVESFGSLIVALFWAFTTDTTLPESAKRGFPIISLFGQLGNIVGPKIFKVKFWGFANSAPIVGIAGAGMIITGIIFWLFMNMTPSKLLEGYKEKGKHGEEKEPGFLEGLRLLFSQGYLLGLFLIISFYELIITVIDQHFKVTAFSNYGTQAEVNDFLSDYATYVGYIASLCLLLGISNIQRRLGMTISLIMLPVLVGVAVLTVYMNPSSINIAMWIMVLSKAINYALNQPTLKQLYIPTSADARYKAQAWIEMFGSRGSKAGGAMWFSMRKTFGLNMFFTATLVMSFGIIGVWLMIAMYISRKYNKAIEEKTIVC